jgi:rare lipoprotein A (peptidoglycan hydrolase)
MLWLICAALWLGGCSAYNASNVASRQVVEPVPTSSAGGRVTVASWYGPGFIGQRTASGEVYHRNDLTAASRSLPLGTRVRVTNLNTGRAVVVRINDRGPYVRGRGIDLSQRAAKRIGLNRSGIARVSVARLDTTASASPRVDAAREWRGKASVSHHVPRHQSRVRHYAHHYTHHYEYASAATYRSSHRMVANPVGDWLLQMVR